MEEDRKKTTHRQPPTSSMDGNANRTRFPYPNKVLRLAPRMSTRTKTQRSGHRKENIKKSMYTKEKKGKGGQAQFGGINPGEYRRKSKDKMKSLSGVAMPLQEKWETHIHQQSIPSETLFCRIATMQNLYIGRAGTTADRSSSRANFTAAAASSSPTTVANRASASCLEQTDVLTLESRWL